MRQKIPLKLECMIYIVTICIGVTVIYFYKRSHTALQHITHEHAVPWDMLEDAYKALNGFTSFYGSTLETLRTFEHKNIVIFGYMYPIEMAETHHHFLLSRQAHICKFHIPAHSGNMVEVIMKDRGMPYSPHPVLLTGEFSIPDNKTSGITFRLEDAQLVDD